MMMMNDKIRESNDEILRKLGAARKMPEATENDEILRKFGVTIEELDRRAEEWESGDWSHMSFAEEIVPGRPTISNEELGTITVKVPLSRLAAMDRIKRDTGMTRSEFVRRAIDNELIAIA